MNDVCKTCQGEIHWVLSEQRWYHDNLADTLCCPATDVEPDWVVG